MSSKVHYLYLITREDGERYVGVSMHPDDRLLQHKRQGNIHLRGQENLRMDILLSGDEEFIYSKEQEYIEKYKCSLNIAPGGGGAFATHSRVGTLNPAAKFTEQQVLDIRHRYANGESQQQLADFYGRPKVTISKIVSGSTWKHVGGPVSKKHSPSTPALISEMKKLVSEGYSYREVGKMLDVSYVTVYNHTKDL